MLTKEEELRLESIIEDIGTYGVPDITQVKWVVSKLKETNDELKKFKEEVNKVVDEEWKKHWERNKEEDEADADVIHSMCTIDSNCDCQ